MGRILVAYLYRRIQFCFPWVLFLILSHFPLNAFDPSLPASGYLHRSWTAADGLPQSTAYCLLQDRTGAVWIGTDSGLARFDGSRFHIFQRWNAFGFPGYPVTALGEAEDGSILVGTTGGGLVRFHGGRFEPIGLEKGMVSESIWTIVPDTDGVLWIGSLDGRIYRWQKNFLRKFGSRTEFPASGIKALIPDHHGGVWTGTERGVVWVGLDETILYELKPRSMSPEVLSLCEDRTGTIWAGTVRGLFYLPKGEGKFRFLEGSERLLIRSLLPLETGGLLIASDSGVFYSAVDRLYPFSANNRLSHTSLLCMRLDSQDHLWVGTFGGGVNLFSESPVTILTQKQGLNENYILSLFEDAEGTMWVGTSGFGVNRLSGYPKFVTESLRGVERSSVYSFADDGRGGIWIGTRKGLYRCIHGVVTRPPEVENLDIPILSLFRGPTGTLWIGTEGGGLFQLRGGILLPIPGYPQDTGEYITCIQEEPDGTLWLASVRDGLKCRRGSRWQTYSRSDGIPGEDVFTLHLDRRGILWVGSSQGLAWMNQGRFETGDDQQGISGKSIFQIIEDEQGGLWCSSNRGILFLPADSVQKLLQGEPSLIDSVELDERQGLLSSVCSGGVQPAGCLDRCGRLWFPTILGVVVIDPQSIHPFQPAFPFIFEEVRVGDQLADQFMDQKGRIRLPPGEYRLSFAYSLPEFISPEDISFRYLFEGAEKEWRSIGIEREMVFPKMGPGRYTMTIRAERNGRLLGTVISPVIIVGRYFWQSPFFFLLLLFSASSLSIRLFILVQRRRKEMKYGSSKIPLHRVFGYLDRLESLMKERQPYLDSALTVAQLAEMVELSPKHLSQIINEQIGLNFNDFVNKYRVEEAIRLLQDPKQRECKLLKIAFDSGFNSKSVFNEAFKKFTGKSPSRFRSDCN